MPRNNTGIYSLPQSPFVPGTVISSAAVNSDLSDIAAALTGSIAANGVTVITGQLKSSVNTTPAYSSNADATTGFGSSTPGEADVWVSGAIIGAFTSTGLAVTGNISATGNLTVTGSITAGSFNFSGTGAIGIPVGTTAQRPVTPVQGQIRYNTTNANFEGYDGTEWDAMSQLNTNYEITASVASNLLTVNVLNGVTGAAPTVADPLAFEFQNGTGAVVHGLVSAALTINTNGVGATLGTANNTPFRFWLVAFYNAGTPVLGLVCCSKPGTIFQLTENQFRNGVPISSAATNLGTVYTPNGVTVTSSPFKILGYVEYASGLATAGTYASPPTSVVHFTPGTKTPGDILQTASVGTSSLTINPISAVNLVKFYGFINGNAQANATAVTVNFTRGVTVIVTQLLGGSVATALNETASAQFLDGPETNAPVTYSIATTGASLTGGSAYIMLDEIMG